MVDVSKLPLGQGPSKNVFLKWFGNGRRATSFTIEKKSTGVILPSNWPVMVARTVNTQLRLRQLPTLHAEIDIENPTPYSFQLLGSAWQLGVDNKHGLFASRTRGAMLVAVNRYDRGLQATFGRDKTFKVTGSYIRTKVLYVTTNLSPYGSMHDLVPVLLADIPGVEPSHFFRYITARRKLGVQVKCGTSDSCQCMSRAQELLPAMWVSQ